MGIKIRGQRTADSRQQTADSGWGTGDRGLLSAVGCLLAAVGFLLMAGCATQEPAPPAPPVQVSERPAAATVDVGIDWGWRLVGDAAARPVQVFSMSGQTYLQMRDRRPVVILVGGQIVPFMVSWPYLIVQGEPERIDIVLEGYRAIAERISSKPVVADPVEPQASAEARARVERTPVVKSADPVYSQPAHEPRRVERVKIQ